MSLVKPCAWYRPELPGYLTGELDARAEAAIRAHVELCEGCRQALLQFREIDELLNTERASRRNVGAFQAAFLERFDHEREREREACSPLPLAPAEEAPSRPRSPRPMMTLFPVALAAGFAGLVLGSWTGPFGLQAEESLSEPPAVASSAAAPDAMVPEPEGGEVPVVPAAASSSSAGALPALAPNVPKQGEVEVVDFAGVEKGVPAAKVVAAPET